MADKIMTSETEEIPDWKLRELDYHRRKELAKDAMRRWFTEELGLKLLPSERDLDRIVMWVRSRWETAADDWNYSPRGLGLNWLPCFICGADGQPNEHGSTAQSDMAAFVRGKEGGEEVVALFESLGLNAKLDFRDYEPNRVQVKVGACATHLPNLMLLEHLTYPNKKLTRAKLLNVMPDAPEE